MWTNRYDPIMTCRPLGVVRQGPPRRSYQTKNDVTLIYLGGDAGGGEYRILPADGREHDPRRREATYLGYTVSRWEGDTLVLEASDCNDFTWFGRGSFLHSEETRVTERFTRHGDVILYDVTVEDPEVLVEPSVIPTRTLRLNTNPAGVCSASGATAASGTSEISSRRFVTSRLPGSWWHEHR